jgi:TctA family transporter
MDALGNLLYGLGVALVPANLLCAVVGGLVGTLVGVLPGIGPVAALALLLPATWALAPVPALILLAALYCGARHGRAIATILAPLPGDAALAGGSPLARQGRAGTALAAAGLASLFASGMAVLVLAICAPLLSTLALSFGPAETFALMVLGLVSAAMLAAGSRLRALAMVVLGMLLGLVGSESESGPVRFAFGIPELEDGIGVVAIAMGVFGYGEILSNLAQNAPAREVIGVRMRSLLPGWQALRELPAAVLRGTALGALLGLVPGGGARLSGFAALALEDKVDGRAGQATGAPSSARAVAACEAASQAGAQTAFLPMLALGLPTNAVMVLLLGALGLHKLQPGPLLQASQPELFWSLIASLLLGNLLLLALNLPLIGLWSRLMRVPYRWLFPVIVLCGALGVYTLHHSIVDIWLVAGFGLAGYVFHKLGMVPAPLLLGFVLGPVMEENLQQALQRSQGNWSVFVLHPLSVGLLLAALAVLVVLPTVKARHTEAFVEQ